MPSAVAAACRATSSRARLGPFARAWAALLRDGPSPPVERDLARALRGTLPYVYAIWLLVLVAAALGVFQPAPAPAPSGGAAAPAASRISGRIRFMTKTKVSATLDPERLAEARAVTGTSNLSQLLDRALAALIEREHERKWIDAHPDDELPGQVQVDLSTVPWDHP